MVAEDFTVELQLEPGWSVIAEPLDHRSKNALRPLYADPSAGKVSVRIAPTDSSDVSGHSVSDTSIAVLLNIGDDVEGHAFTLRFPSSEDAQRLRTRLVAGGLLIAVLTVGTVSIGTELATPRPATVVPNQAVPAAPAAPWISRGLQADIRSGDIVTEEAVPAAPRVNRGLQADIVSGDIIQEEAVPPPAGHGPIKN
jgi:hypothetical protein